MEGEVTKILLNGMEIPFFIAMLICEFAGIIVFFAIGVIHAIRYDVRTPNKFNFRIIWKMSLMRIILAVIIVPISIIYFGDFSKLVFQIDTPLQINGFVAFIMGVSIDRLIEGIIGGSKDSINYLKGK